MPGNEVQVAVLEHVLYWDFLQEAGLPMKPWRAVSDTLAKLPGVKKYQADWRDPTGKGWVLHVACRSARHWSAVRVKLAGFCTISMDGDEEGVALLHDLPAPEQAAVIREALGIRKRVAVSTKQRSRLGELAKAFGFKPKHHGEAVSRARIGGKEVA